MLPIYVEAQELDVEFFRFLDREDPQDWNHPIEVNTDRSTLHP